VATLTSDSRPIIGHGPSLFARLFLLGALSIGIMVLDHRQHYLDVARKWLSSVVYPLQMLMQTPVQAYDWMSDTLSTRDQLKQENTELQAKLRVANLELLRSKALAEENRELRAIRVASTDIKTRTLIAEIIRVDIDPLRHRVLLNHGTNDEVYKGQAVLDADGVFGQITRVGKYSAEVLLITDAEHATPVRVNRTGLRTIAVGTGDFNKLRLPYVTSDADVKVGDLLVTSGLGGVFPPGYPVAQISQVTRDPAQTFALVEAKPMARMDYARELVLLWFDAPQTEDIDKPPVKTAGKSSKAP
jgi:rod shape-determining protein MreC